MARPSRGLLIASSATALAIVAGATTAAAWPSSAPQPSETAVTGTVAAPSEASEGGQELAPAAEAAALAPLAKVTQDQASSAATAAVPGSVTSATLQEEDGFVVWHVVVSNGSTTSTDVSVDAGSGAVLSHEASGGEQGQEASDGDGESADDASTGAQVSDGDGETADDAGTSTGVAG